MNNKKWLLSIISILAIAVLFLFGDTIGKKEGIKNTPNTVSENQPSAGGLTLSAFINNNYATLSTDSVLALCNQQVNLNCAAYLDSLLPNDSAGLQQSANLWLKLYNPNAGADTALFILQRAQQKLALLVEIHPSHANKVKLANVYLQNNQKTMDGITLLLEVVKADSMNADANFLLGKFGIISGQFEKAINRLEKVVSSQPNNAEALFLLAEAHNGNGNKEKAIYYFEQCVLLIENEEFKQEVKAIISELKAS